jgi:hypothetical protein
MERRHWRRVRSGACAVLVIGAVCLLACMSLAARQQGDIPASLRALVDRYGLRVVEAAPRGVTPLRMSSLEELGRFLQDRTVSSATVYQRCTLAPIAVESPSATLTSTAIDTIPLHAYYVCNVVWGTRFNLWATLYRASSGSFHWLDAVRNVRVGLTGLHPFIDLTDTWTDAYIHPDQQGVTISGGGILEYYLYIKGWIVYYSEEASLICIAYI